MECNPAISVHPSTYKQSVPHLFHYDQLYFPMADDDSSGSGLILKLIICLIVTASATVVVTVYLCITARYMRRPSPPETRQKMSMDNSLAELLPMHKYQKGVGLIGVEGGICAICLCEFADGEELRTLPECVHSFHVACIDMWLFSHGNCPMCRTFVGAAGLYSPTLMSLLHPSNTHNMTPMDIL